jgi:hypothetical protein
MIESFHPLKITQRLFYNTKLALNAADELLIEIKNWNENNIHAYFHYR